MNMLSNIQFSLDGYQFKLCRAITQHHYTNIILGRIKKFSCLSFHFSHETGERGRLFY